MSRGVEAKILAGYSLLWQRQPNMAELIPGGLWFGRVPMVGANSAEITEPYAEIEIRPSAIDHNSSAVQIHKYTVQIGVWSKGGAQDAGKIQEYLDISLGTSPGEAKSEQLEECFGMRMIRMQEVPGEWELDQARKDQEEVVLARAAWELTLQVGG